MKYSSLEEARAESANLLHIEDNLGESGNLDTVNHFIFSPHGVKTIASEVDFPFDQNLVPPEFGNLKKLLRSELGLPLAQFSQYQADGGANEVGRAMLDDFADRGQGAVIISPVLIGRGVLDLNRAKENAIGDGLFVVPKIVKADLEKIYDICEKVIFDLLETLLGKNLQSLTQVHTMGSANCTESDRIGLSRATKKVKDSESANKKATYQSPEDLLKLLDLWKKVSERMNTGRERHAIDIITAVKKSQSIAEIESFMDQETAARFKAELESRGIPQTFNRPYSFITNIPGTNLANLAASRGAKQLNCDIPRHLLLADPNDQYGVLTFQPDREKVREIANAIVRSL